MLAWLKARYPAPYRMLSEAWIETLSPPKRPAPLPEHRFVAVEYALRIATAPMGDDIARRRDQAAAAMLFISGTRNSVFVSLPIGYVNIDNRSVSQEPTRGVRTKNHKSQVTYLLDIPELLDVVAQWHAYVSARLAPSAMWYTPITGSWGDMRLADSAPGSNRHVALIRRLRLLAGAAGLPYLSPHKYRHGHAVYALQRARDMADYKAISQNLMHEDISITDGIYAPLVRSEVQQRIAGLRGTTVFRATGATPSTTDLSLPEIADAELSRALRTIARHLAR